MRGMSLGFSEALRLTLESVKPLLAENVALVDSSDRTAASDLYAMMDSPSMDTSRKDGYAVSYRNLSGITSENPARLRLLGTIAAGDDKDIQVKPGTTVRVLTGARIPNGADVVVAEEFVKREEAYVRIEITTELGKNILSRGSDVACGTCILRAGQQITPVMAGLLAAAGHSVIPVFKNPVVGIIGTGDEIVEPGKPLAENKLYASNIVTLAGWCHRHKMMSHLRIVKDNCHAISSILEILSEETDALITSGGAWTGDHDWVAQALGNIGWKKVFHGIRMGPGKAVGFGMLNEKPVFILPGGPISNLMGFLQIALPGLMVLCGHEKPGLPRIKAKLAVELNEGQSDWTDFLFGTLEFYDGLPVFYPMERRSRLSYVAKAAAIAFIPEGKNYISKGSIISVQLL